MSSFHNTIGGTSPPLQGEKYVWRGPSKYLWVLKHHEIIVAAVSSTMEDSWVALVKMETTTISTLTNYRNLSALLPKKANAPTPVSLVEKLKCSSMLSEATIAPPKAQLWDLPDPSLASLGRRHRLKHSRARLQYSVGSQPFQKGGLRALPRTPTGRCLPMF